MRGLLKVMSRVGKNPISIPNQVSVSFNDQLLTVSGPKENCHH